MKKILFIGHEASRTGAPFVLLHFLRWLKANSSVQFQVLLAGGGELESEFARFSPVTVLPWERRTLLRRGMERLGLWQESHKKYLTNFKKRIVKDGIDLIYSNTMINGFILDSLRDIGCPVITHAHELEHTIRYFGPENIELVKKYTCHYIAASESVRNNLVDNHLIPREQVDLIYEFIPTQEPDLEHWGKTRRQIREGLGIPSEAHVIGAVGTIDWRKGADLFIHLANQVLPQARAQQVWFVWLGGDLNSQFYRNIMYDVRLLGFENQIRFLGGKENPLDYMAAFDVLAMISREDPFPLVCLEAASIALPIVYFDEAGGIGEFVRNDCGCSVPYLDIPMMATKIIELLNSPAKRVDLGKQGAQKVREYHDVNVIAPKLLEVIQRLM